MNKHRRLFLVLLFTTLIICLNLSLTPLPPVASSAHVKEQIQEQTAEQVYRNIQVLKGVPAMQLQQVMALFTGALGVRCNYCHTSNSFDKDDKPAKQTARRMVRMMFELNRTNFGDQPAVTCTTCHRGQLKPETVVTLGKSLWLPPPTAKPEPAMPTVEQILAHYAQASGGEAALRKLTTRISRGERIGADGVLVPEEVYQQAPDKLLVITKYPDNPVRAILNGQRGWAVNKDQAQELGGAELAELQREASFHKELALKELYAQMSLAGKELIGERATYVINAQSRSGNPEKLYFDTQTGLLRRRYQESPTVLGPFPLQTDYEDYQKVDGVMLPLTIRWSMPGRVWGRRITEVSHNTPIEDQQFAAPPNINKR